MEEAGSSKSKTDSLEILLQYLDSNLMKLKKNLNDDSFKILFINIWYHTVEILSGLFKNNLEVC